MVGGGGWWVGGGGGMRPNTATSRSFAFAFCFCFYDLVNLHNMVKYIASVQINKQLIFASAFFLLNTIK